MSREIVKKKVTALLERIFKLKLDLNPDQD